MPKLNKIQITAFSNKINALYKDLRKLGVKCRKNFACCGTCGHWEISDGYDGSYVFYSQQANDDLHEGSDSVWLQHNIADHLKARVKDIVKRYGSDWDGTDDTTIEIPFE